MAMNVHTLGENILYDIGIEVKKGRSTRGSLLRLRPGGLDRFGKICTETVRGKSPE